VIRVARAFTCFQLTELLVRVPRLVEKFTADALVVTALPNLYFDEGVRERDAGVTFRHALDALQSLLPLSLGVAVFSDATSFETPRRVRALLGVRKKKDVRAANRAGHRALAIRARWRKRQAALDWGEEL